MSEDWHGERLEIFGDTEAAAVEEGHCLRRAIKHLRAARGDSEDELFVLTSARHYFERVTDQRIVNLDLRDHLLHFKHVGSGQNSFKILELRSARFGAENFALGFAVGISHMYAH